MRVVHISDTHLGFSAYTRADPAEGINQREADIYDAFRQAVDKVLELRPDAVVHAGDMFDTIRPPNRAIDFAMKQLIRLSEAGIPTVLISGNHSTPRLRETGNIFRVFEHLPGIHPVHRPGKEDVVLGDITVTAVPHSTKPSLSETIAGVRPSKDTGKSVLLLHAGILGTRTYRMDEFNEQEIPVDCVPDGFDYVALGHYHKMTEVRDMAYYSGSTERLGFGEVGQDKGILEVDLSSGKVKFHKLRVRDMLELEPVDASSLTSYEILREVKDRVSSSQIDDSIVRLIVRNISGEAHRALDVPGMKRLGSSALHFELKLVRSDEETVVQPGDRAIGTLADEFRKYVLSLDTDQPKKDLLLTMGTPYLSEDEE